MTTTTWWIIGWAAGAAVVLVAAVLLLAIIALARRVARQAADIVSALDGARVNTEPLFDLAEVNLGLEQIARGLGGATAGTAVAAEREDDGGAAGRIGRAIRRAWGS